MFSMTVVDASRDELAAVPWFVLLPEMLIPVFRFWSSVVPPQHACAKLSRKPPWLPTPFAPLHNDAFNSGEKSVAPPVLPTRNSFTTLVPKTETSDSDVVHRVDCWLPVVGNPGKGTCALLVVSGVELMCR